MSVLAMSRPKVLGRSHTHKYKQILDNICPVCQLSDHYHKLKPFVCFLYDYILQLCIFHNHIRWVYMKELCQVKWGILKNITEKKIFHDLLSQLFVFCQINLDNVVHITIFWVSIYKTNLICWINYFFKFKTQNTLN